MDEKEGPPDAVLDNHGNLIERDGVPLSDNQIDNVLIRLKQKEINEQIRSDKVNEGVLKDISNGIDRIADEMEKLFIQSVED